jgi:hydrogenase large subunit
VDLRPDAAMTALAGHLTQAMEARRRAHEMGAIFGGRMPLPHTYVPGGFTSVPAAERISAFRSHLAWLRAFVENTYVPDVEALGEVYDDYRAVGNGWRNLLAFGVFDLDDSGTTTLFKAGYVERSGVSGEVRPEEITESVTHSWYADATSGLNPAMGETQPLYPKGSAYSWLKAPRYQGKPFEAGPLARMWINGDYRSGVSVTDRHLARAYEARKIAQAMNGWLDELQPGAPVFTQGPQGGTGSGAGMTEAPRGALGHWVELNGGKIVRYQVLTPTCWNASPRDDQGVPGPMEEALMGTPIQDPERPIEALRVIHSFDPCLSCAVHVMRPDGRPRVVQAGPSPFPERG